MGKLIGAKPPLRSRLQVEGRTRDLAMFNRAIDSKLRGCDVVAIKVEDVAPHGYAADRATVRQRKTGRPVGFELLIDAPQVGLALAFGAVAQALARPLLGTLIERLQKQA